eukprot:gene12897-17185_t
MKLHCGNQFTSSLVGMLNDFSVMKDTLGNLTAVKTIAFSAKILTTGFWPRQRIRKILYPPEMQAIK